MGRPLVLILQGIYERLVPVLEVVLKGCEAVGGGFDAIDEKIAQSNSQWRMSAEVAQERVLCTMSALMTASARRPQSNSQSNSQLAVSWVDLLQEMITEPEQGLVQGQGLGLRPDSSSITPHYRGMLWRDLLRLCPLVVKGCVGDTVEGGYLLHALLEGGHLDDDPLLSSTLPPTPGHTLLPGHVIGE